MDIDVLGALDVRENGVSITPTAPKQRQVLALLALHADQVVPLSVLVEEVWAGTPPRSARTTLQTYVLQLRDLIGTALLKDAPRTPPRTAKDVLVTAPGGYMLVSGEGVSDVRRFERLAGAGYRAMERRRLPRRRPGTARGPPAVDRYRLRRRAARHPAGDGGQAARGKPPVRPRPAHRGRPAGWAATASCSPN